MLIAFLPSFCSLHICCTPKVTICLCFFCIQLIFAFVCACALPASFIIRCIRNSKKKNAKEIAVAAFRLTVFVFFIPTLFLVWCMTLAPPPTFSGQRIYTSKQIRAKQSFPIPSRSGFCFLKKERDCCILYTWHRRKKANLILFIRINVGWR